MGESASSNLGPNLLTGKRFSCLLCYSGLLCSILWNKMKTVIFDNVLTLVLSYLVSGKVLWDFFSPIPSWWTGGLKPGQRAQLPQIPSQVPSRFVNVQPCSTVELRGGCLCLTWRWYWVCIVQIPWLVNGSTGTSFTDSRKRKTSRLRCKKRVRNRNSHCFFEASLTPTDLTQTSVCVC